MLTRLLLLNVAKFGFMASISTLLLAEIGPGGMPAWVTLSLLINVFVLGWQTNAFFSSYVGGMVPPDEHSSRRYIHWFHSLHLYFNRAPTAKDMLRTITREGV